jgi:hypothetical protein
LSIATIFMIDDYTYKGTNSKGYSLVTTTVL